ncbi:MAG: hypothetical protein IIB77_09475 [Proteobacteria bacterium]|nr:hypothetical protein [Pseudomonadota bacterium]MCH8264922.1 hypothetical protein [Pseudomonadota bacterium]
MIRSQRFVEQVDNRVYEKILCNKKACGKAQRWGVRLEEAFFGFDLNKLALLSPEQWEAYASDRRVGENYL